MNTISLIGRLTADPVEIADGKGLQLRVAYDQAGEGMTTGYVNVTVWNGQAAACLAHLKRGDEIAVTGRLRYHQWETGDGQRRHEHSIAANRIDFLRQAKRGAKTETLAA